MGNGYPITAILGKKNIMQKAQSTFISSTFWTERIGYAAAIATLKEMKKKQSWKKISQIGKKIKSEWTHLAKKHKIDIDIFGIDALPGFKINSKKWQRYRSYIVFTMLKNSILTSNVIYVSVTHTDAILKKYFKILDKIFWDISQFEKSINLNKLKNIPLSQIGFKRLN